MKGASLALLSAIAVVSGIPSPHVHAGIKPAHEFPFVLESKAAALVTHRNPVELLEKSGSCALNTISTLRCGSTEVVTLTSRQRVGVFAVDVPRDATWSVDTCGATLDTILDLFSGCPTNVDMLNTGTSNYFMHNDDTPECPGGASKISRIHTPHGTTVYVRVRGFGGQIGTFPVALNCGQVVTGALAHAETASWQLSVPAGVGWSLDTCSGTDFDTVLVASRGCEALSTKLAENDDGCEQGRGSLLSSALLPAGETARNVHLSGFMHGAFSSAGSYALKLRCDGDPDSSPAAALTPSVSATPVRCGETVSGSLTEQSSRVFQLQGVSGKAVVAHTCGAAGSVAPFDTILEAYAPAEFHEGLARSGQPGQGYFAYDDDGCSPTALGQSSPGSRLSLAQPDLVDGVLVRLRGWGGGGGAYSFTLHCHAHDGAAAPASYAVADASAVCDGLPEFAGVVACGGVFKKAIGPFETAYVGLNLSAVAASATGGVVTIVVETCASDFDTLLGGYASCALGPLLNRSDDSCGTQSSMQLTLPAVAGAGVVSIDGYVGSSGALELHVHCLPPDGASLTPPPPPPPTPKPPSASPPPPFDASVQSASSMSGLRHGLRRFAGGAAAAAGALLVVGVVGSAFLGGA